MEFLPLVRRALAEDRARLDVTSRLFLPPGARAEAEIRARVDGVVAGAAAAAAAFRLMDKDCRVSIAVKDGGTVRRNGAVLKVRGLLASILSSERTALNLLSHLSGIATLTREFVRRVGGRARILDTRKTLAGLRDAQKWAVACGGGMNHRRDLAAAVLIKENHLASVKTDADVREFIRRVGRARSRGLTVEMEARDRKEILLGLQAGVDILLLDNFSPRSLAKAARWIGGLCRAQGLRRPLLAATGGVSLPTVGAIARSGVDRISIGALTHSAPALDMGLDVRVLHG